MTMHKFVLEVSEKVPDFNILIKPYYPGGGVKGIRLTVDFGEWKALDIPIIFVNPNDNHEDDND